MTGLPEIFDLLTRIERDVLDLPQRLLLAAHQINTGGGGLSSIDSYLGLATAGEFRTGNGKEPGKGFSGVRIAHPAMTYNSTTWNIAGVSNDVLQFGLRATDGVALAGAGDVVIDAGGIKIGGTNTRLAFYSANDFVTNIGSLVSSLSGGTTFITVSVRGLPSFTAGDFALDIRSDGQLSDVQVKFIALGSSSVHSQAAIYSSFGTFDGLTMGANAAPNAMLDVRGDGIFTGTITAGTANTDDGRVVINPFTSSTAGSIQALTINAYSSGTPTAGFGSLIRFLAESASNTLRNQSLILSKWRVAADATRKGEMRFQASDDTGDRQFMIGSTDGAAGMIGFFAATPQVQQTSGADLTNNVTAGGSTDVIADYSSLVVYATDAAAIRNDIYQLARKLKQVNDSLRNYGLLT